MLQKQFLCSLLHKSYFSSSAITLNSSSFKFTDLKVEKSPINTSKSINYDNLIFGQTFSDHMLSISWNVSSGWSVPHIHPIKPFFLHPGAKVLHYAQTIFEGTKAFYGVDGKVRLFRPDENCKRFLKSACRSCLPEFDGDELLKCIKKLVQMDIDFVPHTRGRSLYIRPMMFGETPTLGVAASEQVTLSVVCCPVGAYYPTGVKPVSLYADPKMCRAWIGSCGSYKMGSNYAPTLLMQKEAQQKGCQQVLWLFGEEHFITEVGTMNLFVVWENEQGEKELITPQLNDLILPGVTRMSILELARSWKEIKVTEGSITLPQVLKGLKEGRVFEMFGSGTACVVSPVERIVFNETDYTVPTMEDGASVALKFLQELNDIQYGVKGDHKWTFSIV